MKFKRLNPSSWLILSCALSLLAISSCSKQDKVIGVKDDEPAMIAAISKARETLPLFWRAFDKQERGEKDFALKVRITDKHGSEHFWATDIEHRDGKIKGIINNDPNIVTKVKMGDVIEIPEADITDWLYMREGKMVGNFTLKVLFKEMPKKEVEFYKSIMVDP
jgi:uncharacterized protein YegJ (DUF2314 family)